MGWMDDAVHRTLLHAHLDKHALADEIECIEREIDTRNTGNNELNRLQEELADRVQQFNGCKGYIQHAFNIKEKLRSRASRNLTGIIAVPAAVI